jgi:2-polyprenyl-3-methyl-5-hydroxy-6-metoxy-1,4-benzoquinol methylase
MMKKENLKIIEVSHTSSEQLSQLSTRKMKRLETQARFDRLWLINSQKMDPMRNCKERDRVDKTMALICDYLPLVDKTVVDLGCGSGVLSRKIRDKGAKVDAVDISSNALKLIKEQNHQGIETIQDYIPMTTLKDDFYDLVLSTELVALMPEDEYRLYFSELARLVKLEGYVVCSTLIDINSEDALQRFANLAETEFKIEKWAFSYHLCYIKLIDFFKAPSRFVKASYNLEYRQQEMNRRHSFNRFWFRINSNRLPAALWSLLHYPLKPLVIFFLQSNFTLALCEKTTKFFCNDSGISHAIFIGKRRPMLTTLATNEIPKELKHKKQIWE